MHNHWSLLMFVLVALALLAGYPVAFTLAGVGILCAAFGSLFGYFDWALLSALPSRLFGTISNQTLLAVPLFILMGVILEKAKIADDLLQSLAMKSHMGIAVILLGALLAASTGIVGATVITLGILCLPAMLKKGYPATLATGAICATGTLGQIIPPSIALVLLADVLSNAYQQAQLSLGLFSMKTVSVGDLFVGALLPGLLLVTLYCIYVGFATRRSQISTPNTALEVATPPFSHPHNTAPWQAIWPPITLIILVLGSILLGLATPTEAAGLGAMGATLIAWQKKRLSKQALADICQQTAMMTSMIFMILIGASIFALVFRGYGGDDSLRYLLQQLPGGVIGATLVVMFIIFLLGFILDFIEITFIVVPIVGPILLAMGLDPVWLGIMIALNLQTSFLTPPFGFALFYLRSVMPESLPINILYRGIIPFVILQISVMLILCLWPDLATWLPKKLYH